MLLPFPHIVLMDAYLSLQYAFLVALVFVNYLDPYKMTTHHPKIHAIIVYGSIDTLSKHAPLPQAVSVILSNIPLKAYQSTCQMFENIIFSEIVYFMLK